MDLIMDTMAILMDTTMVDITMKEDIMIWFTIMVCSNMALIMKNMIFMPKFIEGIAVNSNMITVIESMVIMEEITMDTLAMVIMEEITMECLVNLSMVIMEEITVVFLGNSNMVTMVESMGIVVMANMEH